MKYDAVVFDLLTALLDSWTLWNDVAGSEADGLKWRRRYLEITYGCGAYRPYETLVREAARDVGLPEKLGSELERRWTELQPWPEASQVLKRIGLPLAASGLLAGWVLAFARGVGEFGATIIFAGNVRGQTQTLTLTIYEQLESSLDVALAIGVLLVVLSGGVLLSYKMVSSWRRSSSTSPSPFARSSSASA